MEVLSSEPTPEWLISLCVERLRKESSGSSTSSSSSSLGGQIRTCQIASLLLNRGLCRVNDSTHLLKIAKQSWTIYAHGQLPIEYRCANESTMETVHPHLEELVKVEPMRSYLKMSFCQVMDYILNTKTSIHLSDIECLIRFINELKRLLDTICDEDRQAIRKRNTDLANAIANSPIDAILLIYWALNETAKYCVSQKFSPVIPTNQYLGFLQKEIAKPFKLSDKIARKFLVSLMSTMDKLVQDRVSQSSIPHQTFIASKNIEDFYKLNYTNFQSWSVKNLQPLAKLSLIVDEPAECWRNMNLKLFSDLDTKFSCFNSASKEPSFTRTLNSLSSKNWTNNLQLLAVAAKQLGDLDLLYGLKSMSNSEGVIPYYEPLDAMIANLEGDYDQVYNSFDKCKDYRDEQNYLEFLNSCMALDKFEGQIDAIEKLETPKLRAIYKLYWATKDETKLTTTHLKELEQWLSSWTDLNDEASSPQPVQTYIDIVMPTCLNIITKAANENDKQATIGWTEKFLTQDFLKQSIFPPNHINSNHKIWYILLNCLKHDDRTLIDDDAIIEAHQNDYKWNFELYRHLRNLKLVDKLRSSRDKSIDLIQFKAGKFMMKIKNYVEAQSILSDLGDKTDSREIVLKTILQVLKNHQHNTIDINKFSENIVTASSIDAKLKAKLSCKLMNHMIKINTEWTSFKHPRQIELACCETNKPPEDAGINNYPTLSVWRHLAYSSDSSTKIKSLILISKHFEDIYVADDQRVEIINSAVSIELEILSCLSIKENAYHQSIGIQAISKLIWFLNDGSKKVNQRNLNLFKSKRFIETTKPLWMRMKRTLVSLITNETRLSSEWRLAFIDLLKSITKTKPELFIYDVLVSRLDVYNNNTINLNPVSPLGRFESPARAMNNQNVKLWDELYEIIRTSDDDRHNDWNKIIMETEAFIKEIRKISYLPHEYLKSLTLKTPRRLVNLLEYVTKNCSESSNRTIYQFEFLRKLTNIRENDLKSLKVLTAYYDEPDKMSQFTLHEKKFYSDFKVYLKELEYRLTLLVNKKTLVLKDFEKLIRSITELMAKCRGQILLIQNEMRQTLYMEMISPKLSRLKPSSILMPNGGGGGGGGGGHENNNKPLVTIHSTSQTVNMIHSKTNPKRLRFVGSDGKSKCFLLKAHEDLRLDQLFMDLFHLLNVHFSANKETREKFRLRSYSVTPVSGRSGLIEWIDAKALSSFLRSWLATENGQKSMESVYKSTCEVLCNNNNNKNDGGGRLLNVGDDHLQNAHERCQLPNGILCMDAFYQLLWAELIRRNGDHSLAQIRPSSANTTKIRAEFGQSMFVTCIQQLMAVVPKDFVSNQLWFNSCNSHQYWIKTKRFIHSTAAISIVGNIIGLGDRHTDNILLDSSTGEVVHIDYNICFETGQTLSVPEKVPFRLTPNIVHAFGFAGLEGGFKRSCQSVLKVMRENLRTITCQLRPNNLAFMIRQADPLDEVGGQDSSADLTMLKQKQLINTQQQQQLPVGMEIYSQESIDTNDGCNDFPEKFMPRCDDEATDLMPFTNAPKITTDQANSGAPVVEPAKCIGGGGAVALQASCYLQDQIKTPTKISEDEACHIVVNQVMPKLEGYNEVYINLAKKLPANVDKYKGLSMSQLSRINFVPLKIEDEVEVLIKEATSLENKAAMFEGWLAWL